MAHVLHRVSKAFRKSVNTPDFPTADWIVNPDLTAVQGQPDKYWTITGDVVGLMNQSERDAVDVLDEAGVKDSIVNQFDVSDIPRLVAEAILSEINLLRAEHGLAMRTKKQLKMFIRSKI